MYAARHLKTVALVAIFMVFFCSVALADKTKTDLISSMQQQTVVTESEGKKESLQSLSASSAGNEGTLHEKPSGEKLPPVNAERGVQGNSAVLTGNAEQGTPSPFAGHYGETAASLCVTLPNNDKGNKALDNSFSLFTDRLREKFTLWLERSARYIEIMKEILKERQLPEDMVFLPLIESGFNPNAYSRARAVGPWQFIEATAKRYGLIVDWWRDERKDPLKSTDAAARYLNDLYKMFGSWNLALAAYNAGEGKILRALKKTDSKDYWSLLHTKQIRNETKQYVSHFIAAAIIANTPEEYGFHNLLYHEPLEFDEVKTDEPLDIEVIAECAGTSAEEIRALNPELRRWSTPPNVTSYTIRIPKGTSQLFIDNLSEVSSEEQFSFDTYKVKKGEDIKKVAKKFNVPVGVILALNDMSGLERLKAGDTIKVPPEDKHAPDIDDKMSAKKAKSSSAKVSVKRNSQSDKLKKSVSKVTGKKSGNKVKTKKA